MAIVTNSQLKALLESNAETTINNFRKVKQKLEQMESDFAPSSLVQSVNLKQDISNLVTTLSNESTNTQYPSAKCVYDLIGNLETLLQSV